MIESNLDQGASEESLTADLPLLDFYNLSRKELAEVLEANFSVPGYRAQQVFEWVYRYKVTDFEQMTNLSRLLREKLSRAFYFPKTEIRDRQISTDGTRKYLFGMENGNEIESVMIKQPKRMTLCVSSQVGCGMGCSFCRTATMGFHRHLSTSEIMRQVLAVIADAENFNDMFNNIVFMGMGEPFHNFDNVTRAVEILTDAMGLEIAPRRITISTVGLVPAIERFGTRGLDVNLAISLNATTNEVRSQIMPITKAYSLDRLIESLKGLPLRGRKKLTIEYVMLSGVNDSDDDLKRLPKLLNGIPAKVNLIPYNSNAGLGFEPPSTEKIHLWQDYLTKRGLNTTVRWSKGRDIDAACGQLAVKSNKKIRKNVQPTGVVSLAVLSS